MERLLRVGEECVVCLLFSERYDDHGVYKLYV